MCIPPLRFSLSVSLLLNPPSLARSPSHSPSVVSESEQPSASFVTGAQGETSTIKPTILNEQAGATNPRGGETHVTAASRPSVESGGANSSWRWRGWMRARDSTHSAREDGRGRGAGRGQYPNTVLLVFVDSPSMRCNPPKRMVVRRRGSSTETLIAWIKWLLVFV